MKRARSATELFRRLDAGEIVPVTTSNWQGWEERFDVTDRVLTGMGAPILVVRWPLGERRRHWGIVEESQAAERVVRPMATGAEVKALIAKRMAAYERMWDG
ncbi:hypothetical protein DRQ50_03635 [bacterium]|nr:MAG: hypothetical protein DRQ50_03635 [bacterium]